MISMVLLAWIITFFSAAVIALFTSVILGVGLAGIEIGIDKFFDWKHKK